MHNHKVCQKCKYRVSSTWLTSPQCKKCKGFDMFEREVEDVQFKRMYVTTGMRFGKTFLEEEIKDRMTTDGVKSVFRTVNEAHEALAQKYGNRKDYNKMNLNKNISVNIGGKYFKPISCEATFSQFEYPRYNINVEVNPDYMIAEKANPHTLIKKVIFNPPATIVFWPDKSKTVVKAQNDEEFDPEKGLAMAIVKKCFGNQGNYFNEIKKWTEPYAKSDDECQTK